MKKKQKTFAERAKAIEKKYPRAQWDAIERKDMLNELRKLRDEQEEFRSAMGIADNEQGEQVQEYKDGSFVKQPVPLKINQDYLNPSDLYQGYNKQLANMPNYEASKNFSFNKAYMPLSASVLPSAISAGASIIGDVAGLINRKKNTPLPLRYPRVATQDINLEPARESLRRDYGNAMNVALTNSRMASNPANAYANQVAGITALTDSLGQGISQSYLNEATANTGARNQANLTNANMKMQEISDNAKMMTDYYNQTGQYISNIADVVPKALADYRAQVNQNNMINVLGKDYGLYQYTPENQNFWQWLRSNLGGSNMTVLNRRDPRIRNT